MSSKVIWNWGIVLVTVGLVAAPVVADQFQSEIARWQLAAATYALKQDPAEAAKYVEQAQRQVKDVAQLRDYWLYRINAALLDSRGDVADVVTQAIKADPGNYTLGLFYASQQLYDQGQFEEAVKVLEASCIRDLRNEPFLLNQLAYFRALAGIELETALTDINRALKNRPDDAALRDTRAWVLFKMGRPREALEDADFAVQSIDQASEAQGLSKVLESLEAMLVGQPEPRAEDKVRTRKEAGIELWQDGALYYHRARILEALGETEKAEADFAWLRARQLPTDDRLY